MIGMPTPQVDPSPSSNRTCTGFPVTAGDVEAEGPVDAGPADDDGPPCQAPSDDDPSQAATRASVTPSTVAPAADRHERENLMLRRCSQPGSAATRGASLLIRITCLLIPISP
ncbi:hypothetical protein Ato02nite_039300 [Paractinoplanes toevensis]|uniref:Uncharacterized protein n=1 Tax=Paractinoplanes toevensis TaxID=571911 RepID=A0A919TBB6_9ACTN|nr:hypothetical protein Ato02nite_039300 [Actinoplanes toevensis]